MYRDQQNKRESGIRSVRIGGISVQVSHQKGALIIWGTRELNGRTVTLRGGDNPLSATFRPFRVNNETKYAAAFSRVLPDNYWTDGGYDIKFASVTINTGWVEQLDWR